ncbi:NUDIX hydrolase [Streptomyces sp. MS1.AVA.3]|uniref:NUDIX hydrolase n=1 Tax=Streptomyces decoyicus TaxID=249567 RepID=UPI0030BC381F
MRRTVGDVMGGLWELSSGGVGPGEGLLNALHREVKEETGLPLVSLDDYLGHFDCTSSSGQRARPFTFAASADRNVPVQLSPDEHDACLWADEAGQERVSPAVRLLWTPGRPVPNAGDDTTRCCPQRPPDTERACETRESRPCTASALHVGGERPSR